MERRYRIKKNGELMKISEIIKNNERTFSVEVFPPKKKDGFETIKNAISEIAKMKPSFMSVTYGAGGGTSEFTQQIAKSIYEKHGVSSIAHLTCVSSSKDTVKQRISELYGLGIENILALRGDIPPEMMNCDSSRLYYTHALDLIDEIKKSGYDFCIGGACYPECHPESTSEKDDLFFIKEKAERGCEFFTTQMFFDNNLYYSFVEKLSKIGVNTPVIAGIMPLTAKKQVERSVELSGSYIPAEFLKLVEEYGDDAEKMKEIGTEFAIKQIRSLYENGVKNIHLYSMNKPETARIIKDAVCDLCTL